MDVSKEITMEQLLLRIPEVCALTQLSRSTIYSILDKPDGLKTVRIGRAVRVPVEEVQHWVDRQKNPDTPSEGCI